MKKSIFRPTGMFLRKYFGKRRKFISVNFVKSKVLGLVMLLKSAKLTSPPNKWFLMKVMILKISVQTTK